METMKSTAQGEEQVSLSTLASITGFPESFVKSELLLGNEPLTLDELRQSVLSYLTKEFSN